MDLQIILAIAIGAGIPLFVGIAIYKTLFARRAQKTDGEPLLIDTAALESAERALKESGEQDWVVLKRFHGPAYSHTAMAEIVSALNAEGVEATYDVVGTSSADGGVTNYMLKVLPGSEEEALAVLAKMESA